MHAEALLLTRWNNMKNDISCPLYLKTCFLSALVIFMPYIQK